MSAFVDAVDHFAGSNAENDRPDADFHLNIYQTFDTPFWPDLWGGPTTGLLATDKEIFVTQDTGWDHSDNHYLIDDDSLVQDEVKSWIDLHLDR